MKMNLLPNYELAVIPYDKFIRYSLDPDSIRGANKARVYQSALGFNLSNAELLIEQIRQKLPAYEAVSQLPGEYGNRYTVDIPITGVNGKTELVRTAWQIDYGKTIPHLVSNYVLLRRR
ncbi:MAG: hypothetical protein LBN97_09885 [Oscillospiraceae bacterium]|jgi:hypothetical protein|nr:hypothetical protein [Oscillospiraceae bacterium]